MDDFFTDEDRGFLNGYDGNDHILAYSLRNLKSR